MFNASIREYFPVLNVFIVCIRNTARSKSNPLLCTHVDSYMFSTLHPPGIICVHSTNLKSLLYIHILLSSCHLGLVRLLGSCATFKLMVYDVSLNAFSLPIPNVPLGVNRNVHIGVTPEPNSPPHGGSNGVFFLSAIIVAKSNFFGLNLI